jgi:hypothetical protein
MNKMMIRAALAALSIASIGPAFADSYDGQVWPDKPAVSAQAPVQKPPVATEQNGQSLYAYVTSSNRGSPFRLNESGGAQ